MRASLFITCLADTLFPQAGIATVSVLERVGVEVDFPRGQTCCGQMHANSGHEAEALTLMRRTLDVFAASELVVTPSGSCAAMLREGYGRLAAATGDPDLSERVEDLAARTVELSELLVGRMGIDDVGAAFPHRVTLHTTCHSTRLLKVGDGPRRLLAAVDGIDLVDLPAAEQCCGFGGTFAVKNADTSTAMLTDKVRRILDTGAEVCTAADASCLMHIGGAMARQRSGVRTMHMAEILAAQER